MKYTFLFIALLVFGTLQAQDHSCCQRSLSGPNSLATEAAFIAAHEAPAPLNWSPVKGEMVYFETLDAIRAYAYYVPASEATNKVLIIFHEWWGLNDYIKKEAEKWQEALGAVDVYAIDLYDGHVATTPDEASRLMSGLTKERGENIIKGLLAYAGRDKTVATLGWCMGGTWSFAATVLAGQQAAGCVMYYGFPETEAKKITPLKTDVLYIRGSKDQFITVAAVDAFSKAVTGTGHKFELHAFPADHAFANPSNPHYDVAATQSAYDLALKFLKAKLRLE